MEILSGYVVIPLALSDVPPFTKEILKKLFSPLPSHTQLLIYFVLFVFLLVLIGHRHGLDQHSRTSRQQDGSPRCFFFFFFSFFFLFFVSNFNSTKVFLFFFDKNILIGCCKLEASSTCNECNRMNELMNAGMPV